MGAYSHAASCWPRPTAVYAPAPQIQIVASICRHKADAQDFGFAEGKLVNGLARVPCFTLVHMIFSFEWTQANSAYVATLPNSKTRLVRGGAAFRGAKARRLAQAVIHSADDSVKVFGRINRSSWTKPSRFMRLRT